MCHVNCTERVLEALVLFWILSSAVCRGSVEAHTVSAVVLTTTPPPHPSMMASV